jgi:mono/diheme cytochrome c family protein
MSKRKLLLFLLPLLLVVGVAAFLLARGGGSAGVAPVSSATPLVGDPAAGQGIYAQRCASCHGSEGGGGRARALVPANATLRGSDAQAFNANVIRIVTHGKGRMPAWGDTGRLTPQQIADVAAYILSLNE